MAQAYLDEWTASIRRSAGAWRASLVPPRLADAYGSLNTQATTMEQGDHIIDTIMHLLDAYPGCKRSLGQMKLHTEMLATMLPAIYRESYLYNAARVLKRLGLKEVRQEVLVVAARRAGKTFGLAIFCCALLMGLPSATIAVFGVSRDTTRRFLKIVLQILDSHEEGKRMVVRPTNVDRIRMRGVGDAYTNDERNLLGFAGQAKVLFSECGYIGGAPANALPDHALQTPTQIFRLVVASYFCYLFELFSRAAFFAMSGRAKAPKPQKRVKPTTAATMRRIRQAPTNKNCLHGFSKPGIRRLAKANQVDRVSALMFREVIEGSVIPRLEEIARRALPLCIAAKRKTIQVGDVEVAIAALTARPAAIPLSQLNV